MELVARPSCLSTVGKVMVALLIVELASIWMLGFYSYITLPEEVPTRFGLGGRPTAYGEKVMFLILSAALSPVPIIFLVITKLRFRLINHHPYLLNLPAFYTYLHRLPYEERGRWVNKYFEAVLGLGCSLTLFLLFLEWSAYQGALAKGLPFWFVPSTVVLPIALVFSFVYYLRTLSRKMIGSIRR